MNRRRRRRVERVSYSSSSKVLPPQANAARHVHPLCPTLAHSHTHLCCIPYRAECRRGADSRRLEPRRLNAKQSAGRCTCANYCYCPLPTRPLVRAPRLALCCFSASPSSSFFFFIFLFFNPALYQPFRASLWPPISIF